MSKVSRKTRRPSDLGFALLLGCMILSFVWVYLTTFSPQLLTELKLPQAPKLNPLKPDAFSWLRANAAGDTKIKALATKSFDAEKQAAVRVVDKKGSSSEQAGSADSLSILGERLKILQSQNSGVQKGAATDKGTLTPDGDKVIAKGGAPEFIVEVFHQSDDDAPLININSADEVELKNLPLIGPKEAAAIEKFRRAQLQTSLELPFNEIEDLTLVAGIDPAWVNFLESFTIIEEAGFDPEADAVDLEASENLPSLKKETLPHTLDSRDDLNLKEWVVSMPGAKWMAVHFDHFDIPIDQPLSILAFTGGEGESAGDVQLTGKYAGNLGELQTRPIPGDRLLIRWPHTLEDNDDIEAIPNYFFLDQVVGYFEN